MKGAVTSEIVTISRKQAEWAVPESGNREEMDEEFIVDPSRYPAN